MGNLNTSERSEIELLKSLKDAIKDMPARIAQNVAIDVEE